jgi:putative ABC transport system permease protein
LNALTFPLRNLRNHPMRSILTSASIGAALASLLALVGLSRGVDSAVVLSMKDRGTDIVAVRKGSVEVLTADVDEGLAASLRTVPGVAGVMSSMGDIVELESGDTVYMEGWSSDGYFWQTLKVTAGKLPEPADTGSVVLGQSLAESLGKKPGDRIELVAKSFQIAAVSRQASIIDDRSVMMPLPALQQLLGREGKVSGFHIRIDRPNDSGRLAEVRGRLAESFPQLTFVESGEMTHYVQLTGLLRAMAWASSSVSLVMAFVIVLNTLLMAVTERTREMGLLSAIGWKPSRVIAAIVLEGVLMAAAGSVFGIGAGLLGLQVLIRQPQLRGFLQPEVTPVLVLESVLLVLLVGALGALYPAWRTTRMRPMDLLRGG